MAWPSVMPTSSTVWWLPVSRSPRASTSMSISEWRASRVSMWSKKPTPVEIRDAPLPSRSTRTRTSVSPVVRLRDASRLTTASGAPRPTGGA